MAMNIPLFIILTISIYACLSSALPNDMNWWCDQTPNPEPCKHFMSTKTQKLGVVLGKSNFRKASLELAMERALNAESHTKWLGQRCRNKQEKAAWSDCLELYESTISQLNQTIDPTIKCTDFDTQTWLSTALTNLETCRAGFMELNASDYMLPLMNNNVTKLISNTLALNNGSKKPYESYKDGFPTWVLPGDRKLLQTAAPRANIVVAQDGSGNYRTIKAAVDAAAKRSGSGRFVIYIKKGVYRENVEIGNKMKNIMLVGDGLKSTIITGSRSVGGGTTTFKSGTVIVTGSGFIARGITFRNTAGPQNHQAVALRSGSDLSVFYLCSFEGYQDTLYVHSQRQFYKSCYIYGTVDFIFGNAAVVFQNCMIYGRRPMASQKITITAQGRTDQNQNTGIVIHNSRIMASSDLKPVLSSFKTFLGRPWKQYSRTVFMKSYMDRLVDPAGWLEWDGNFALNTLYYGEYRNIGPGSSTSRRVKWRGYRVITNTNEASSRYHLYLGKSNLFGVGVPIGEVEAMANIVGCRANKLPFLYLGLPNLYGHNGGFFGGWKSAIGTSHWSQILAAVTKMHVSGVILEDTVYKEVRNGKDTRFWDDCWITTRVALSRKGMEIPSILCAVCGTVAESINHIFCECLVATQVWEAILKWLDIPIFRPMGPGDVFDWVDDCRLGTNRKNAIEAVVCTTFWVLWRYRIDVVHESRLMRNAMLFDTIREYSFLWFSNRHRKMTIYWTACFKTL
ncbi:hypothetical protein LXL04_012023 [Taraxacum kok-saghyz]